MSLVWLVGLALAACGGSDGATTASPTPTAAEPDEPVAVDCDSRIQLIPSRHHRGPIPESARRTSVVAGTVVFIDAKRYADYPRASKPGIRIRTKVPISVESGPAVTITLSTESQNDALITVGQAQEPNEVRGHSVTLRPCPPGAMVAGRRVGRRTPFAAGFRLHGPTCVYLEVEIDGEPGPIARQIPFGVSCSSG